MSPERRYERALREWVEREGWHWERLTYPRPAAGGITTAYRLEPSHPRGLVVFAHGAGNDALFPQVNLFRALLEAGFAVWSSDLDGHGRGSSTRLDPTVVSSAVPEALARARTAHPGLPLHLLAQSFGAALGLAALPNADVASAVLISPPLRVRPTARTVLGELSGFASRSCLGQRRHYGAWDLIPAFGSFKRSTYPIRLAQHRARAWDYVGAVNETLDRLDLLNTARRIRTPVRLVYGGRDWIVPLDQGRTLREHLPNAELIVLPRETHYTAPFAPETEGAMLEWFGERSPERTPAAAVPCQAAPSAAEARTL